jgi:hypothetical protein
MASRVTPIRTLINNNTRASKEEKREREIDKENYRYPLAGIFLLFFDFVAGDTIGLQRATELDVTEFGINLSKYFRCMEA